MTALRFLRERGNRSIPQRFREAVEILKENVIKKYFLKHVIPKDMCFCYTLS